MYDDVSARYYDESYLAKEDLTDLPFYLDLAKSARGPVLEIACGTGRILIPTARAGVEIDGLDNAEPMLAILERSLAAESQEVRERVRVHRGDMRGFDLDRQFPLVTIPFRPMQHMYTLDEQIAALTAAKRHVAPGGRLAFNVFYPDFARLGQGIGKEHLELEWADGDAVIRRYFKKTGVHLLEQFFTGEFVFRTMRGDEVVLEEREPLKMCWYTYPQMQLLFRIVGLRTVEEFGSFERDPIAVCREMIFVLERD